MARARRPPRFEPPVLTLEERLHRAHDHFALLAHVFDLQAVAPDYLADGPLSAPAARALAEGCRREARHVRSLLDTLPAAVTDWTPALGEQVLVGRAKFGDERDS